MSTTFHLTSDASSILSNDFFPPIELNVNKQYGLGLIGFYAYHSIKNIGLKNNTICLEIKDQDKFWAYVMERGKIWSEFEMMDRNKFLEKMVEREIRWAESTSSSDLGLDSIKIHMPPGAYEIDEINKHIQEDLWNYLYPDIKVVNQQLIDDFFKMTANNNTLKCEIKSKFIVNFGCGNSLADLVGFANEKYQPSLKIESTMPINIMNFGLIRLDCNIIAGSYINGKEAHTIFSFDIDVEPGYKLTKEPHNIMYLPVTPSGRQYIDNITIRIVDDNGELLDFGGETINIILELKEIN